MKDKASKNNANKGQPLPKLTEHIKLWVVWALMDSSITTAEILEELERAQAKIQDVLTKVKDGNNE